MKVNGPYIHKTGRLKGRRYVNIIFDDGRKTSVLYSRYLMEQYLGRKLSYDETVDHIDNDFTNDDFDNLQIITRSQNAAKRHVDTKNFKTLVTLVCVNCQTEFVRDNRFEKHNRKQGKKGPFCGKSCAAKWSRMQQLSQGT